MRQLKRNDHDFLAILEILLTLSTSNLYLGTLCYGNEPSTTEPNVEKAVSCVIFNAKIKRYALHAQNEAITNEGLQTLYEKFAGNSDPTIQQTKNKNGGFLFKDYQQFKMIAQQTTGGEVRQLYFEVLLDLDKNCEEKRSRENEHCYYKKTLNDAPIRCAHSCVKLYCFYHSKT